MSTTPSVEAALSRAMDRERDYDWLGAVEFYKQALGLVPKMDFLKLGEVQERIGCAFYRAAMQAENVNQFRDRMRETITNYEKTKEFYGRSSKPEKTPRMLRCDAMLAYVSYWLSSEVPKKKRLLDECWRLTKEALNAFREAGDALEYGKTFNQLSTSAAFSFFFEWDFQAREKIMTEAVEHGEQAVKFLSTMGDPHELARAYVRTALFLEGFGLSFLDLDARDKYYQKALGYWQKANEASEETALIELSNSALPGGEESLGLGTGTEEAITTFKKALEYGRKTKDKFIVGCALDWLAYHTAWKEKTTEDPDERMELAKKALQYAEDAKQQYSQISFASPRYGRFHVETCYAEHYWDLASYETNLGKRRELLEKAVEAAEDGLKRAEDSGYPEIIGDAHGGSASILVDITKVETNSGEKKRHLERALVHSNEYVRITEQFQPFHYWNRGVMLDELANIKSELANLAKDSETKKSILQEAVIDKENALKLCVKYAVFFEREGSIALFARLGSRQHEYGDFLNCLYGLTTNGEHLKKAVKAFEDAAESFQKLHLVSRMAECYWKVAQAYNTLGEHLNAAQNFDHTSNCYNEAAKKIPQLKDFYQDHALYMQAWSEIEKARHHHGRQEYGLAKEHYEKAASMHKSLKQWSYLTPNYSAWTQVENAEDLSRREQSEDAAHAFEEAAKLFNETKKFLQTELSKIENLDEKTMATNLIKASDSRREYCFGRMALEEAKILDKKGDHYTSSEKYGSALEIFQKITEALELEQDRRELKLITILSQAWQRMTRAEAEDSPNLYIEASQLFDEAKELNPNEKAKMLASGHSRFCRALEAGTRFADTRDPTLHTAAIKHLESAATYYVKADFQNASEYAKATELLFDAYMHVDNAKKENDPEKKARLYTVAEKVLQSSAGSFMKAEHPEKREQVLKLLEKVKEERELAVSLTEVLHAPSIVSTTTAFATPSPTHENAVGLERFEHANIQANLITRQRELKIGESLDLEIELVNAGKGPALLVKLAEVIPQGFELAQKPETYRVEDSYLNMKGKRLDPLKTEEVRLVLKPKVQGVFSLKPRVLYLDENGKYKSHDPEPITLTVKELGIKGWIKGER